MNKIKSISKDLPWLMPGVGFQGGSLKDSIEVENNGLSVINVSRGILNYGNKTINDIRKATEMYTNEIRSFL
jgi:orotidine-5'-phosphate decarboxylase